MLRKPNLISFTGADDNVNVSDLVILSRRFPAIEWGILYHPEKEGQTRNPTAAWRESFLEHPFRSTAIHLCGEQVFRELLEDNDTTLRHICRYERVQVNINARQQTFNREEIKGVYDRLLTCGHPVILQYHDASAETIQWYLSQLDDRRRSLVQILFDSSRGKGISPTGWPKPLRDPQAPDEYMYCGYAGNLGPGNIRDEITKIQEASAEHPLGYWIDMESGVRYQNQFSMVKVTQTMNGI